MKVENRLDMLEGKLALLERNFKPWYFKRDILKNWVEVNPVLRFNEIGLILEKKEDNESRLYVKGDGVSKFSELTIKIIE